jgi:hypothetical protein
MEGSAFKSADSASHSSNRHRGGEDHDNTRLVEWRTETVAVISARARARQAAEAATRQPSVLAAAVPVRRERVHEDPSGWWRNPQRTRLPFLPSAITNA